MKAMSISGRRRISSFTVGCCKGTKYNHNIHAFAILKPETFLVTENFQASISPPQSAPHAFIKRPVREKQYIFPPCDGNIYCMYYQLIFKHRSFGNFNQTVRGGVYGKISFEAKRENIPYVPLDSNIRGLLKSAAYFYIRTA